MSILTHGFEKLKDVRFGFQNCFEIKLNFKIYFIVVKQLETEDPFSSPAHIYRYA
jgi:hypothetical protein